LAFAEWSNHSYPLSEKIHDTVLSIPARSYLTDVEVKKVVNVINNY